MDLLFSRSIHIQDIIGFSPPDIQIRPTRIFFLFLKKGIMAKKPNRCSIQKWCTNNCSLVNFPANSRILFSWLDLVINAWSNAPNLKMERNRKSQDLSSVPWKREHLLMSLRSRTENRRAKPWRWKAEIAEKMKVTNTWDTMERVRDADISASSQHRYNYHLILSPGALSSFQHPALGVNHQRKTCTHAMSSIRCCACNPTWSEVLMSCSVMGLA